MSRKLCWSILAVLCCSTWGLAQEPDPPPPPADEAPAAQPEDRPPPPAADDADSPSDERPELNGRRTSRGYAGQAPGKQAPWSQGPQQAPGKQAPMQQGPTQAPGKGTAAYGDQTHTMGYAANYNCAGCAPSYQQPTYYSGNRTARRGLFGRRWR